jgi:hypothetical protein
MLTTPQSLGVIYISPYKNPEDKRAYMREYYRRKRSGVDPTRFLDPAWQLQTAEDLRRVLENVLRELLESNADIIVKSRAAATLLSVGLRLIELTDFEKRLIALEQKGQIQQSAARSRPQEGLEK